MLTVYREAHGQTQPNAAKSYSASSSRGSGVSHYDEQFNNAVTDATGSDVHNDEKGARSSEK